MAIGSAAGYLLLWLALVLSPCLMAMTPLTAVDNAAIGSHVGMHADTWSAAQPEPAAHDCEHCPPVVCDLAQADVLVSNCDSVNTMLQTTSPLDDLEQASSAVFEFTFAQQPRFNPPHYPDRPPLRAGPRRHLLHLQFNE